MQAAETSLFGPFCLDPSNRCLWRGTQAIALTPKAFAVLQYLVAHAGRLVSKEVLLEAVWPETAVCDAVLKVCIAEIRRALGDSAKAPRFIATTYRLGYRFIARVTKADRRSAGRGTGLWQRTAPDDASRARRDASVDRLHLVGREAELTRLREWFDRAEGGERQVVFVTGEAGIGKTAVVEAFVAEVARDAQLQVARGQCLEHYGAGEPYLPVLEALGRLCREPGHERLVPLLRRQAPTWLAQLPWLLSAAEREELHRELLGATRRRMLREMADLVEALTVETPLILVVEDLHWSDYATLDLLAVLARRREPARFLLLGTYRPGDVIVGGHPLRVVKQELQRHGYCEELPLPLLGYEAVAQYLNARFPGGALPVEVVQVLYQRTDGHPLFLTAAVDALVKQGLIVERNGQWALQVEPEALGMEVPESVRQMFEQQIERLSHEEQRVLEAASVAGVEFSAAVVAAGMEADVETMEERCERLARRQQFLRPAGVAEWPDGTVTACYRFLHWLYQHMWYQRIGTTRRVHLHRRIGQRLEKAYRHCIDEIAAELVVHSRRGRDHGQAVQYLQQAAQNALQRHAYREAITYLTEGLKFLKALPESPQRTQRELDMQTTLGPALIATKGYAAPEVELAYLRARELCQQVGDTALVFRALRGLWNCYLVRAELRTARQLAEQLLTIAQRSHEPALLVEAHRALGATLLFLGELLSARTHLQEGIALYDPQQHHDLAVLYGADPGVMCLLYVASVLWLLGFANQALQRIDEALTLAQERAHPFSLAFALSFAAQIHQRRREVQPTQRQAEAAMTISTDYGFPFFLTWGTVLQGWSLAEQGRGEAGIAQIRHGLDAWDATGTKLTRPHAFALLADVYGKGRRVQEGLRVLDEAFTAVNTTGERWWAAELHRLQGEFLLMPAVGNGGAPMAAPDRSTRLAGAETCFRQALDIAHCQGAKSLELRAAMSLSRLWRCQGKRAEAQRLLAEIYDGFTEGFDTADLRVAKSLLVEW